MTPSSVPVFCKQINCPSARSLMTYRAGLLTTVQRERISQHLGECEFCGAELQLLVRCSSKEIRVEAGRAKRAGELPPHLKNLFEKMIDSELCAPDYSRRR